MGKVISKKPPRLPPALRYAADEALPHWSNVQLLASKSKPLFTVCPDRIAWMPGTTKAGLATRAAKSVTTKTMNPTNARVHKTERTDRPPDGGGGGR